jgi:hypothetical protein
MDRHEVALAVDRELGDLEPVLDEKALDLIRVGAAVRSLGEIEDDGIEGRHLHAGEAQRASPGGQGRQPAEGRLGRQELGEEHAWPADRAHHSCRQTGWAGGGGGVAPR